MLKLYIIIGNLDSQNLPVVLVLRELSFRQKEYLIREKIPFIVDGKQIYLPFMAVYLQERCSAEKKTREEILPELYRDIPCHHLQS